jgi:FkbM family methyltransferase
MAGIGKLTEFWRCAASLGTDSAAKWSIFWRETKNVRVRLGLAKHAPDRVYTLRTRGGPLHFRDNFGDITNLPNLFWREVYRGPTEPGPGAVLDVGANIGLAAAWYALNYPGRPIHCFEPLEENARMARLNCRTAIVNNVAVGSRAGTVELRVDRDAVMASTIPWERAVSSRTLQLVTLDDYVRDRGIDRVAVLKIDTEGMELDVLDGAVATLAITGVVAMETHGEDRHEGTLDRLRSAGLGIDHQEFDGRTGMVFASTRAPVGGSAGTDAVSGARSWQQAD